MPKKITFSKNQLAELKNLIEQGHTQSEIASHFEVTADTIRKICRENHIDLSMKHLCKCVICGDEFYSQRKGQKTCNKDHYSKCVICGNEFKVDRFNIKQTCSAECTCMLNRGTLYPTQSSEVKEKIKSTCQIKYGVDHASQAESVKQKVAETCIAKYGVSNYRATQECESKIRQTNLEKYGYETQFSSFAFKERCNQINQSKYGTIYPAQSTQVKSKIQQTVSERYGTDNVMRVPEIKASIRQKNIARYGVTSPSMLEEIKQKVSQTCLTKFGVPWACMREEARNYKAVSKLNLAFGQFLTEHSLQFQSEFPLENYSFDFRVGSTLIELNPTITHNSAISIFGNGQPKQIDYHLRKSVVAANYGYRCIHVFDWDKWEDIVDLLNPKQRVFARTCEVKEISSQSANEFINANHIQGQCKGATVLLGLFHQDKLVQVMTLGLSRYDEKFDFELLRLCTQRGLTVVGGASKLFSHFVKLNPTSSIISYCDKSKFSGDVYPQIGRNLLRESSPAKVWSRGSDKITDNLLRQRGYDQLFSTNFGKGTSNEELMLQNGWLPVYDCGQKVFGFSLNLLVKSEP